MAEAWAEGAAKGTHRQVVALQIRQAAGELRPYQLTPLLLDAMTLQWRKRWAHSTCYARQMVLRTLLRYMESLGGPKRLDKQIATIHKPAGRQTMLTPEETVKLFGHAEPWVRVVLLLCYDCGFRLREAARAQIADVDREHRLIRLRTKNHKLKTAALTPEIEKILDTLPTSAEPGETLVRALGGPTRTENSIYNHWRALKAKLGIRESLRPHDLRRTMATLLYRQTHDIRLVQQYLGHSNLSTTAIYLVEEDPAKLRPLIHELRWERGGPERIQ